MRTLVPHGAGCCYGLGATNRAGPAGSSRAVSPQPPNTSETSNSTSLSPRTSGSQSTDCERPMSPSCRGLRGEQGGRSFGHQARRDGERGRELPPGDVARPQRIGRDRGERMMARAGPHHDVGKGGRGLAPVGRSAAGHEGSERQVARHRVAGEPNVQGRLSAGADEQRRAAPLDDHAHVGPYLVSDRVQGGAAGTVVQLPVAVAVPDGLILQRVGQGRLCGRKYMSS